MRNRRPGWVVRSSLKLSAIRAIQDSPHTGNYRNNVNDIQAALNDEPAAAGECSTLRNAFEEAAIYLRIESIQRAGAKGCGKDRAG